MPLTVPVIKRIICGTTILANCVHRVMFHFACSALLFIVNNQDIGLSIKVLIAIEFRRKYPQQSGSLE